MKADPRFQYLDKEFWANVRSISETLKYGNKKVGIRVPTCGEMKKALQFRNLGYAHICDEQDHLTALGELIEAYFSYRAQVINTFIEPNLMDVNRAKAVFEEIRARLNTALPVPMNKQTGEKKTPAYFTSIINMLIQQNIGGLECNYNPQQLTTITKHNRPYRTLARRVDGAFPSTVNPIAVWEIKEYYYTTTFGSRIADGVYESLLDGMELEEIQQSGGIQVMHLLMVDAYSTWWQQGKPYLCRIIDMLYMGYVDHVLFGYEVVEALPGIVQDWVETYQQRLANLR